MQCLVKASFIAFLVVMCIGCGQKNQNIDSEKSAQTGSVENMGIITDTQQSSRPLLSLVKDSSEKEQSPFSGLGLDSVKDTLQTNKKRVVYSDYSEKIKVNGNHPEIKVIKKQLVSEKAKNNEKRNAKETNPKNYDTVRKISAKELSEQYEGLKARSRRYYQIALGFLGKQDDSALIYTNKAIQSFENGSLFRVKAEALSNQNYFSDAAIACDVCLHRTDHWDFTDVDRALKIKCLCYKKRYERFPSQESKEAYEIACKAAGVAVVGGK